MFAISVLGLVRGKVYVRDTPKEGPLQLKPQANLMQLSSSQRWRVRKHINKVLTDRTLG